MSLLIFSGLTPVFAVRFAHSMASFAGLPGSGELRLYFSLCQLLLRRQTQVFCFSFDAKEKRIPSLVKFLFSNDFPIFPLDNPLPPCYHKAHKTDRFLE